MILTLTFTLPKKTTEHELNLKVFSAQKGCCLLAVEHIKTIKDGQKFVENTQRYLLLWSLQRIIQFGDGKILNFLLQTTLQVWIWYLFCLKLEVIHLRLEMWPKPLIFFSLDWKIKLFQLVGITRIDLPRSTQSLWSTVTYKRKLNHILQLYSH